MEQKISRKKISVLAQAITALDNLPSGAPESKQPMVLKFKNAGKTRYALAKTLANLQGASEALEKARKGIVDQSVAEQNEALKKEGKEPQTELIPNSKWLIQANEQYTQASEELETVDVRTVTIEDLDLDVNNIPLSIVSPLLGTVVTD